MRASGCSVLRALVRPRVANVVVQCAARQASSFLAETSTQTPWTRLAALTSCPARDAARSAAARHGAARAFGGTAALAAVRTRVRRRPTKRHRRSTSDIVMDERPIPAFYCCYLLRSTVRRASLYVGSTPDPRRRLGQHNGSTKGGASRTAQSRLQPWEMACIISGFPSTIAALQFEWAWQHPHLSKKIPDSQRPLGKRAGTSLVSRLGTLHLLLRSPAFARWPLTARFFARDVYEAWMHWCERESTRLPPALRVVLDTRILEEGEDDDAENSEAEERPKKRRKSKWAASGVGGVQGLDISDAAHELSVAKSRRVLEAEDDAASTARCAICRMDAPTGELVVCAHGACEHISHLSCLARAFLAEEKGCGVDSVLPIGGHCPACRKWSHWGDVTKELSLRTRSKVPVPRKATAAKAARKTSAVARKPAARKEKGKGKDRSRRGTPTSDLSSSDNEGDDVGELPPAKAARKPASRKEKAKAKAKSRSRSRSRSGTPISELSSSSDNDDEDDNGKSTAKARKSTAATKKPATPKGKTKAKTKTKTKGKSKSRPGTPTSSSDNDDDNAGNPTAKARKLTVAAKKPATPKVKTKAKTKTKTKTKGKGKGRRGTPLSSSSSSSSESDSDDGVGDVSALDLADIPEGREAEARRAATESSSIIDLADSDSGLNSSSNSNSTLPRKRGRSSTTTATATTKKKKKTSELLPAVAEEVVPPRKRGRPPAKKPPAIVTVIEDSEDDGDGGGDSDGWDDVEVI